MNPDLNDIIPGAPFFRWREFFRSATADRLGVNNVPDDAAIWRNVQYLAANVLQPLRENFGPLRITSGYRCPSVNRAVGSTQSSFHAYGMAADVEPLAADAGFTLKDMFVHIYEKLPFTELIAEEWPDGWVHVALQQGRGNEHQLKYKLAGAKGVRKASFAEIMSRFA